ncbi:AraC family transcriptional regulator [Dickeya solani]|uniref:Helix-turn-helix transcriptional regulator n=1 Tax=Dickeya solani TaxID=1089444 RepID=A0ABU4EDA5_9GAMM|nr:helix-turn-helix transcriptional regulator [Dickeya solani]MCA6998298.1 helix-turn-helix transcriptional regulator [Dickeya solani]MCZ0822485.1 helix-turn-helix transcriptional regulator [Dickeya solani]MDV6994097.1 helix-turn-helix transcriptional regulator [Dickeya solani]MDV7004305.1 helix-turn-helix transcriptional regulator [Dickeya solani]MDV7038378.1 helix-turn-helix transcriptional regulator [Dickeya solani]
MPNNIYKAPRHDETIGWSVLARSYRRGDIDPPHYHAEGQLLYATQGVMLVETGEKRWVIPPQRALWLPALQEHSYSLLSHTELRTMYFSRSLIDACSRFTKSDAVHVITATALVKELIAGLFSADYKAASQRTMALLLMEILSEAEHRVTELPMPQDERLSRVAADLLVNQRWATPVSDLADLATMSERTFSRLFIRDTGFSFRNWKQRARICVSLDLLSAGVPIKQVAYQLGFSCPAAFTAAFRSILGATPRDFLI